MRKYLTFSLISLVISIAWGVSGEVGAAELRKITPQNNSAALSVSTPDNLYCKNPPVNELEAMHTDHSVGRSGHVVESPSPFFTAKVLDVPVDVDIKSCNEHCRRAISHAVLSALGLWRSGCSRCESKNLNVVRINGLVWIDSISVAKWRYAVANNIQATDFDPNAGSRKSYRPFGLQPKIDFIQSRYLKFLEPVCDKRITINVDDSLLSSVCSQTVESLPCETGKCLSLPVRLGKDRSNCQLNKDTIACGTPDFEIGLNIDDYRFRYQMNGQGEPVIFGAGEETVSLLYTAIHELGHWFGIAHDTHTTPKWPINVMNDVYPAGTAPWCVSEWNLIQLDNAVSLNWSPRLIVNSGLKYRR